MRSALVRHIVIVVVVTAGVILGLVAPGQAQMELYDNFLIGFIHPDLWQGVSLEGDFDTPTTEVVRLVENGNLRLGVVSWGDDSSNQGGSASGQALQMRQLGTPGGSGFITGMKTKLSVRNAVVQDCPTNPLTGANIRARAGLLGWFFQSSGASANDATGNVIAGLQLTKEANGSNLVFPVLVVCADPTCSTLNQPNVTGIGPFVGQWTLNTPVVLKLVWNEANGKFKYKVKGTTAGIETREIVYTGIVPDVGPPTAGDLKQIRVANDVKNCSGSRKQVTMDALFQNVSVRRQP